jgi:hypothetical protein
MGGDGPTDNPEAPRSLLLNLTHIDVKRAGLAINRAISRAESIHAFWVVGALWSMLCSLDSIERHLEKATEDAGVLEAKEGVKDNG